MNLSGLAALPLPDLAALCGLTIQGNRGGGVGCGPCPACHEAVVSRNDRRAPVLLRHSPEALSGAWVCGACHRSGTRADLLCLATVGRGWSECSQEEQARALGRSAPTGASVALPAPARRYLTPEEWLLICERTRPARTDDGCCAWAERRGLPLTPEMRALPYEADQDLPFWSTSPTAPPLWLPGRGLRLLMPCTDASGLVRGARLRNTKADATPTWKERGLPGFSAVGLCYASEALRKRWAQGLGSERPVTVVEGGPDWLAALKAWGGKRSKPGSGREIVGFFSGSFSGRWMELLHADTMIVTQLDPVNERTGRRQGTEYGEAFVRRVPRARIVTMAQVYAAAGLPHAEKLDLASGEIVGRWPGWRW